MAGLLADLERRRSELLEELSRLGNFRAGSITALTRRCGKASCRCSRPDDPGHGPNLRLTYKLRSKTYSESLPDEATQRRVEKEIAEFRKFQQFIRAFVDINTKICLLSSAVRPINENVQTQTRERLKRSLGTGTTGEAMTASLSKRRSKRLNKKRSAPGTIPGTT